MRQIVKVGSYWLVFYKRSSDSYIVYRVSTDGIRWGDEKLASHAAAVGTSSYYDMGVEAKGTEVFIAYDLGSSSTSDMTVNLTYTRRGVFSAGSISWDAAVQMHTCGGYPYYSLVKTTNRVYLAIHAIMNSSNPRYRISVYYSTDDGATWTRILDKDSTLCAATTYASGMSMVWWPQYDDGIIIVTGRYDSSTYSYKTYTGAAWAAASTVGAKTGSAYARFDAWSLATAGGKVHFVYAPSEAGGRLQYQTFVTSWAAAAYLDAAGVTSLAPSLTPRNDYLYLFNIIGGTIYRRRMIYSSSTWSGAVSWIAGETSAARVNTPIYDEDEAGSSSICVIYRTVAAAPFTEKSALLGLIGNDLPSEFYVQIPFANLPAEFYVLHPSLNEELPAEFIVRHSASQNLHSRFYVQQPFANLQAGFKVRNIGSVNEQSRFISGNRTAHDFAASGFDDGELGLNSRVVYANGLYWVFYRPTGTSLAYKTSSDGGVTWQAGATALGLSYSLDVVMDADNVTAHFVSGRSGNTAGTVYYRKGTLNSDGTITWAAAAQSVATGARGKVMIDLTTSGYPCVLYNKDTSENPPVYYYLAISSTNDGTFTHVAGSPWLVDEDPDEPWGNYMIQFRSLTNGLILLVRFIYNVTPGAVPPKSRIFDPSDGSFTDWVVFADGVDDVGFSSVDQNTIQKYGTNHAFVLCYALLPSHPVIRAWFYDYDSDSWTYIGQLDLTAAAVAPVECPSASVAESGNFIACYWWNEASKKKYRRIWFTNNTLEASNLEIQGSVNWDTDIGVLVATPRRIVRDVFSGVWYQTDTSGGSKFFFDWLGGELGDHENLPAEFVVKNEFEVNLQAALKVRQSDYEGLKAKLLLSAPGSADLQSGLVVRNKGTLDLPSEFIVRKSSSANLQAGFQITHSEDLRAVFRISLHGMAELLAHFVVNTIVSEDLHADFTVRHSSSSDLQSELYIRFRGSEELRSEFLIRKSAYAVLPARLNVTHSLGLQAGFIVRHGASSQLPAELVVRHPGLADLLGEVVIRHSDAEELVADFTIRKSSIAELSAEFVVRQAYNEGLLAEMIVRNYGTQNLKGVLIVRHSGFEELKAQFLPRHSGSSALLGALIVRNKSAQDLLIHLVIRHSATLDLKAAFKLTRSGDLLAEFYVRPDTLRGDHLEILSNNRLRIGGSDRTFTISARRRIKVIG